MAASIFISYRQDDSVSESREICTALRNRGATVFWDARSIDPGDDWPDEIRQRLLEAETVLVVVKDWNRWMGVGQYGIRRIDKEDDWVRQEVALALDKKKKVIPVLVGDDESLAPAESLPEDLRSLTSKQKFPVRNSVDKFDVDLKYLLQKVFPKLPIDAPATGVPEVPVEQVTELLLSAYHESVRQSWVNRWSNLESDGDGDAPDAG